MSLSGQKSQKSSKAALLLETLGEICVLATPAEAPASLTHHPAPLQSVFFIVSTSYFDLPASLLIRMSCDYFGPT